jgi:hypothetical protein
MNRTDLHRLSNARLREAKILFSAAEYSGSYYLAGYAAECGLKACFTKGINRYDFPMKGVGRVFTHNLAELVTLADLNAEMNAATTANPEFNARWEVVRRWSEESRYSTWTRDDAEIILDAISMRRDGVLTWIKRYW